tara:strand:+ start:9731 stop:11485 length:1755 start_codon:yes stop_codon:yes gene_type:complete
MTALNQSPLPQAEGSNLPASTVLTQNLPLLAGAPNGIKKLRELILELAVRGKLVPQDPNDEPASELLKRIAEEKARLVVEGKIKKQKPLAEVDETTQPFELPVDWAWTRLGEITNFGTTTKKDEIPDDAWVLDLEDIEKDTSRLLQRTHFYERNSLSDKNSFTKGDVLYGKLRPYLNKVLVAEDDGFCTTEILPFRCHGPFVAHYFMIALKSPYFLSYVNARSYGMKMPRLGTEDGRQAFFPLPPLAEQHRIVAKVDELMALCDRLEAQQADAESAHAQLVQALLDSLTHASDATEFAANWQRLAEHFHTLFTTEPSIDALKQTLLQLAVMGKLVPQDPADESASELLQRIQTEKQRLMAEGKLKKQKPLAAIDEDEKPYELPPQWQWSRLGSHVIESGAGWSPSCDPRRRDGNEWGVLKVSAVSWGLYRPEENKALPAGLDPRPEHQVVEGDFLVSRANTAELVARSVVVENTPVNLMLSDKIVRLKLTSFCDRRYVNFVNSAAFAREYYGRVAAGTSSSMKNVSREQILSLLIPLPPLTEQHRIVAKVDQLMALCDQLKTRLTKARQLNQQLASTLVEQAVA